MRLIVATDSNRVVVIDDLLPLVEYGSLNVRLDRVALVLSAIRDGVNALTSHDAAVRETQPGRQHELAQIIAGVAQAAKALAQSAPAGDANADQTWGALYQLGFVQAPSRTHNVVAAVTVPFESTDPV